MSSTPNDLPLHDRLADEYDQIDWDADAYGHMEEYATEHEPLTEVV